MIDLIASASIGGLIGFGICAVLTMGKVADQNGSWRDGYNSGFDDGHYDGVSQAADAQDAHTRCSDALETARNRIERALAVETPKAAHGVKKMAAILRGDA